MMSTVIGGAMLPHAPQFFTMPETEDKKVVEHVRDVAAEIGRKLRAQYMADAPAFADKFQLPPDQREALIKLDLASIVKMGAHPLVPFLAQLQIQRLRPRP